jgi:hypothetical protein
VRAPFTAIDVPPDDYYYYGPEYPPPVRVERRIVRQAYPDAIEFAAMSDAELERAIFGISQDLYNDLRRFNTGSTWQRYLRLPDAMLDRGTPAGERIEATITLLERFYKISDDPQYSMIARVPSFVAMQAALNEAVARHEEGRGPREPETGEPATSQPTPPQSSSPPIPPQSTPAEPDQLESTDEDLPLPAPSQPSRQGRDQPFLRPRN